MSFNPASAASSGLGAVVGAPQSPGTQPASARNRWLVLAWSLMALLACVLVPWQGSADALWFLALPGKLWKPGQGVALVAGLRTDVMPWVLLPFVTGLLALSRVGAGGFAVILQCAGLLGLALITLAGLGMFGSRISYGLGTTIYALAALAWLCIGMAQAGRFNGDGFVAGLVLSSLVLLLLFTVIPTVVMLANGFVNQSGETSLARFIECLSSPRLWGVGGGVWNTLIIGVVTATLCTLFGLALALLLTRTRSGWHKWVRLAAMLPIVTPPFVVGMGMILLLGRSGLVNNVLEWAFGIEPTRWIYGMPGIILAEVFAFTPVAYIVLVSVVEGVSPTLEEAAQTLRAGRWRIFWDVSLPLMRPGLVSAFLITFVETLADFGNTLILGANTSVLATEIFFAIVGADVDPGRAAVYSALLLAFTLAAFLLQRLALGRGSYTSMSGKGDSGLHAPLPSGLQRACTGFVVGWTVLTLGLFLMILVGGFVVTWGRNYTPTLEHFVNAFAIEGGRFTGMAWESLNETLLIGAFTAPITALMGVLIAWVIARHDFRGKRAFEFSTLLSLAVPGTVTGVAYLLCFNVPPLELTGTAAIIALCLLFRNLPVAVQAGGAALAQLDKSLDEASLTLGARSFRTFCSIDLPLLKPVLVGTLMYGFVRASTTISAVIFLVSAEHEMATTFIVNRILNGDYGVAVAYSIVLIAMSIGALALIRVLVGDRHIARRSAGGFKGAGA